MYKFTTSFGTGINVVPDAYLAGLFDGEGCIGMYKRGAWTLQVTMSQKGVEVLHLFNERFPGGLWHTFPRVTNLTWYGTKPFELLEALQPLLVVKAEQAALALKYIEMSRAHLRGSPYTTAERAAIEDIAQRIKAAKRDQRGT